MRICVRQASDLQVLDLQTIEMGSYVIPYPLGAALALIFMLNLFASQAFYKQLMLLFARA